VTAASTSVARVLDGRKLAETLRAGIADEISAFRKSGHDAPRLAAVLVGDNPASAVYVRSKARACAQAGIEAEVHRLPADASEADVLRLVEDLNSRSEVDGILVQMPLPSQVSPRRVIQAVDPLKDVDGFHPLNVGRLWRGEPGHVPCTPAGIMELLTRSGIDPAGKRAVVIGRSDIVGKPMAALLLHRHATVTLCHSRTPDLAAVAREADILVAAIGRAAFVTGAFIRPGAAVVDVGMNQVSGPDEAARLFDGDPARVEEVRSKGYTLVGDVHPAEARRVAGALTPVPGGVGPLTIALLLRNTLKAAIDRRGGRSS
jgi:methylenetetrahydrofolate dehydrogenase (NADP+)/methenyltetrahydrofolate cyclohydrolase